MGRGQSAQTTRQLVGQLVGLLRTAAEFSSPPPNGERFNCCFAVMNSAGRRMQLFLSLLLLPLEVQPDSLLFLSLSQSYSLRLQLWPGRRPVLAPQIYMGGPRVFRVSGNTLFLPRDRLVALCGAKPNQMCSPPLLSPTTPAF